MTMKKINPDAVRELAALKGDSAKTAKIPRNPAQKAAQEAVDRNLVRSSRRTGGQLLTDYHTDIHGYSAQQADEQRKHYGSNEVQVRKKESWPRRLLASFVDPFTCVLLVIALVSLITDVILASPGQKDPSTLLIILVMVLLSGLMRFVQETRSNNSAEKLQAMVHTTATVSRDGQGPQEVPLADIVPGDIVTLSAGDTIPADLRLLDCKDLFINQSALTGESEPVEKMSDPTRADEGDQPLQLDNLAFMGSNVVSGSAIGIVVATGRDTYFGQVARSITGKREQTSFDKGISSISWLLIRFMLVMVPVVLFILGFTKHDWVQAFLFGLSVAVGLTPEMLPMIVTTGLARGAVEMGRKKVIVKHLNSIQNFGAMDVLCTDKTGTITRNQVVLESYLNVNGEEDARVLDTAFLNSYYQTGLKNLMDRAILKHASLATLSRFEKEYTKVDEIPFDFERRRMSVVIRDTHGQTIMITKGAVEEMLGLSTSAQIGGKAVAMTQDLRASVLRRVKGLNSRGMRVLALAVKHDPSPVGVLSVRDESEMTLVGLLAFLDPPKPTAREALAALRDAGVAVKVLTGDNDAVTRYVCQKVGLPVDDLLLGSDIENMDDKQLARQAEKTTVFAKLSPQQKARVVRVLRADGHTVGLMGDGINDAPAMHQSDVGISVDSAVDVAKESADIILLKRDLMVLEQGVIEGRQTFGNIIKYVKLTVSSNFGNMFSVLFASIFLPFLPMQPLQLIFLNLLYDFSCIAISWDHNDPEFLRVPRKWDAGTVGRFMLWFGPTSSVFDILTYGFMFFVICPMVAGGAWGSAGVHSALFVTVFNTGWFIESLMTQTLVVHMIRTPKIPFVQSCASRPVLISTACAIAVGIAIPYTSLAPALKMTALPGAYFPWLLAVCVCYMLLTTVVKKIYVHKYGELL